jgi:hypothetical protein
MKTIHETVVAEQAPEGCWLAMFPDGTVAEFQTAKALEHEVRKRAWRQAKAANAAVFTTLDWRNGRG